MQPVGKLIQLKNNTFPSVFFSFSFFPRSFTNWISPLRCFPRARVPHGRAQRENGNRTVGQRAAASLAAEIRACLPVRLLPPDIAFPPFWGAAEHSWNKVRGGCNSQRAPKETGCSVATRLMYLTKSSRRQTWTLVTLKAPNMGMWGTFHSCISLKSLILREGEELATFSFSLDESCPQEGQGKDSRQC